MATQYIEKRKIFTNVVSKDAVLVTIQTLIHLIHGYIYVRPGERIKDELAHSDGFLAVTDATVYNSQGVELYQAGFLAVNREHIVWLIPDEEISDHRNAEGAE
jgi:hypothetical protein